MSLGSDFDKHVWRRREVCVFERHLRAYLRDPLPASLDVNDCIQETYTRLLRCSAEKLQLTVNTVGKHASNALKRCTTCMAPRH